MNRRAGVFALVLVSLVVAIAWAGRVSDGARALREHDAALERHDAREAIAAGRRAAEARCPGCTASAVGFARLEALAKSAEERGEDDIAFAAWNAVRSATLSTAVASAQSAERKRADDEIARIGARLDAKVSHSLPSPATEARLKNALAEDAMPSGTTYAFVGLGGWLFLWAGARLVRKLSRPSAFSRF